MVCEKAVKMKEFDTAFCLSPLKDPRNEQRQLKNLHGLWNMFLIGSRDSKKGPGNVGESSA